MSTCRRYRRRFNGSRIVTYRMSIYRDMYPNYTYESKLLSPSTELERLLCHYLQHPSGYQSLFSRTKSPVARTCGVTLLALGFHEGVPASETSFGNTADWPEGHSHKKKEVPFEVAVVKKRMADKKRRALEHVVELQRYHTSCPSYQAWSGNKRSP
jgi:hypothetical protein